MSSMNPPWETGWPGRGPRRHRRPGPGFGPGSGPAEAYMAPPEPPDDPDDQIGRGRGADRLRRRAAGFGPGGPPRGFPGRGFPGRGGRRGRRTPRGDVRSAVLALVAEQPRHGYEIIQEIGERTVGVWRPSPGSIYPTVSQLEDEGLVRTEKVDGRRVIHLTEAGTRHVEEHRAELDAVWDAASRDVDDDATALWEQLSQLHAAAHQVMSAGTPEQITAAGAALAEARKTIYRLLAE